MQEGRPLSYPSMGLEGMSIHLSTYEKELMALVVAVQKWNQYLLGRRFRIRTDHQSLKFLLDHRLHTRI